MSVDIELVFEAVTGGPKPYRMRLWDTSVTYNLGPMWHAVGWDFQEADRKPAGSLLSWVHSCIDNLESDPDKYKALNPANGWGDYDGLVEFFREAAREFAQHPKAIVRVT